MVPSFQLFKGNLSPHFNGHLLACYSSIGTISFIPINIPDFLLVFSVLYIYSEKSTHDFKEFILLKLAKILCEN